MLLVPAVPLVPVALAVPPGPAPVVAEADDVVLAELEDASVSVSVSVALSLPELEPPGAEPLHAGAPPRASRNRHDVSSRCRMCIVPATRRETPVSLPSPGRRKTLQTARGAISCRALLGFVASRDLGTMGVSRRVGAWTVCLLVVALHAAEHEAETPAEDANDASDFGDPDDAVEECPEPCDGDGACIEGTPSLVINCAESCLEAHFCADGESCVVDDGLAVCAPADDDAHDRIHSTYAVVMEHRGSELAR